MHQVCSALIYDHFLNDCLDYIAIGSSALFIFAVFKNSCKLKEYLFEAIFSFFLFLLSDDVNVNEVIYECFNFGIVIMDAVKLSIIVHNCVNEKLAYGEEARNASQTLASTAAMEADCLV